MRSDKTMSLENNILKSIKAILISTIIGIFISMMVLIVSSFLFVKSKNLPSSVISPFTIATSALGAFISGYISSRIIKSNGLLLGMISGFLMFVIIFVSGLMMFNGEITTLSLVKLTSMLLTGAIGGIAGVNKKSRR